ncbi:MAG TPA: 2-amino-4-hydroxy-6-hydroxymethyldihydropteridine diphosphokinase [Thermoanaerobaculia bacterium]|nr:2-amino-4-hydroxy-6-hydroxymethyldihydropteridine diphosphokinase [Thermoanaerobaculia bacterium]
MSVAFVALGSNLGDRAATLDRAIARLGEHLEVGARSLWIETEPVGGPPQGRFLNGVVRIETELSPRALLALLQRVEHELGRERSVPDAPRTLDLDLLLYDDRVIDEPGLRVPHPRLHRRRFVLEPLCEIAPDWRHPESRRTMAELLAELEREGV